MKYKLLLALTVSTYAAGEQAAQADVVSDRVFLVTGATGCPTNSMGFKRIRQTPDGTTVPETAEFVVPSGKYLEITSIEYTTPHSTPWAQSYVQYLTVSIRQRSGTGAASVFNASYQNRTMYDEDASYNLSAFGQYVSPGAETHVASFPAGPLMSPAGRLCVTATSNFYTFGGSVRVRGRLIPSDTLATAPSSGSVLSP